MFVGLKVPVIPSNYSYKTINHSYWSYKPTERYLGGLTLYGKREKIVTSLRVKWESYMYPVGVQKTRVSCRFRPSDSEMVLIHSH